MPQHLSIGLGSPKCFHGPQSACNGEERHEDQFVILAFAPILPDKEAGERQDSDENKAELNSYAAKVAALLITHAQPSFAMPGVGLSSTLLRAA